MAGSDTIGPAYPCLSAVSGDSISLTDDSCTGLPYHRKLPALELVGEIAVVGEYALRRQIAVMSKARVLVP